MAAKQPALRATGTMPMPASCALHGRRPVVAAAFTSSGGRHGTCMFQAMDTTTTRRKKMSRSRKLGLLLLILVLALLLLRLMLPSMIERTVNRQLADMGEYSGQVADVDVALWRGAYVLHGLRIDKVSGEVPVPMLDAPRIDIALSWRNLLRGAIVARVAFEQPVLNFVDGRGSDDSLTGAGVDWRQQLEDLVPIRIDEVQLRDGEVVFNNFVSDPPVDLRATAVNADIENLTNVRDEDGQRVAQMSGTAHLFDSADLEAEASFDPFGRMDEFTLAMRVLAIDLTRVNDLAQAYANLDFESGNGEFVMELEAADGQLSGYAKPLFQNLSIFSWRSDVVEDDKNPLRLAWEALVEGVTTVLRNQPADQFGTRIEISGRIDNPDLGVFGAVIEVLRNAFVRALEPYFEGTALPERE